jgi:hypothetical protein
MGCRLCLPWESRLPCGGGGGCLGYEGCGEKLCEWCILLLFFPGLETGLADLRLNVVKLLTVRRVPLCRRHSITPYNPRLFRLHLSNCRLEYFLSNSCCITPSSSSRCANTKDCSAHFLHFASFSC